MHTVNVLGRRVNLVVGALFCVFYVQVVSAKTPTDQRPASASRSTASSSNADTRKILSSSDASPEAEKPSAHTPNSSVAAETQLPENASPPQPDTQNTKTSAHPYAAIAAVAAVLSALLSAACLVLVALQRIPLGKRVAGNDDSKIVTAVELALKRHMANLMETTTQGFTRIERCLDAPASANREELQRQTRTAPPNEPTNAPQDELPSAPPPTQASAAPPPAPPVTRADVAALLPAVKQAIRTVAESGSSITSANVTSRVSASIPSEATRGELSRAGMSIELFDGDGRPSVQAAELMAIRFQALDSPIRLVFPFPYAGKVSRFVYWFGQGDYRTDPVLAEVPAMAETGPDGALQKTKNGSLRKT